MMEFIAKVEDSQLANIREIAESLGKIGVEVRQVQPMLGLISGSSGSLTLEQVKIPGIASVERDRNWGAGMPSGKKEERDGGRAKRKD